MTKINECGQLEFTFEEIDFVGAFDDILEDLNDISVIKSFLNRELDALSSYTDCDFYNYNNDLYRKVRQRGEMLLEIMGYVRRLAAGMNYND